MSDSTPSIAAVLGLGIVASVGIGVFLGRDYMDWSEWGPPLIIFGAAVAGGLGLATTMGRDESEAEQVEAAGHREDLERRHSAALEGLAALETQKSQMTPEDYNSERKALLSMGANALRELDASGVSAKTSSPPLTGAAPVPNNNALAEGVAKLTEALTQGDIDAATYAQAVAALSQAQTAAPAASIPSPAAAPKAPATSSPSTEATQTPGLAPQWSGAIYAVVGLGLIATLLYFVQSEAQPRREGAGMTGNQELSAGERPPASAEPAYMAAAKQKALADLAENGDNIEALNTLTQLSFQEPQQAWQYNQKAREVNPENPDALVFEAVITTIMGMPDKAQEKFDAVLAKHPDHAAGWAYKGLTLMEAKRYKEAIVPLEKAIQFGVSDHAITNALGIAKAGGPNELGAPPPMGSPPAGAPPTGPSPILASGTLTLDASRSTYAGKTVFVSIKDPAMPGPPLASLKLPPGPFPMEFQITEANKLSMGGRNRPIPANMLVVARLDDDGNAMPSPNDPVARAEGVAKGTEGLSLTLK